MLVLAVDTTSEHGGAAIFQDEECLASVAHQGAMNTFSVALFQMVNQLIAKACPQGQLKRLSDIELFAVANGPGSFTGIRVGLAAAQGWSKAFGRPLRGVSILEALVEAAQPDSDLAVPVIDARRGEFYVQAFRRKPEGGAGCFVPAGDGLVLMPDALSQFVAECMDEGRSVTCIIREHDGAAINLRASLSPDISWHPVPSTLLQAISRLARRAAARGESASPDELDAFYIRRTDAELNWKG